MDRCSESSPVHKPSVLIIDCTSYLGMRMLHCATARPIRDEEVSFNRPVPYQVTTYPILREIPSELRTRRLYLRCPRPGDGRLVHEAVVETLEHLRAWPASLPWARFEPSVEASEVYCRESAAAFIKRQTFVYLAFDSSGEFVASTSLHSINWDVPKFELGFWCRASQQRKGLTAEAATELVRLGFDELSGRRITALPDEANHASRAVCAAAGLELEAVMRNECAAPGGELRNTCLYAAVRGKS